MSKEVKYIRKVGDRAFLFETYEQPLRTQIKELKQQLKEKGQEINIKNNKLAELKKELTICKDKLRRKTQSNRDLQHRVHNVNTQLAIQELAEVERLLYESHYKEIDNKYYAEYEDINNLIYSRIKALEESKGE